ncbi:unnamed protein product [Diplocarpon coronariae]
MLTLSRSPKNNPPRPRFEGRALDLSSGLFPVLLALLHCAMLYFSPLGTEGSRSSKTPKRETVQRSCPCPVRAEKKKKVKISSATLVLLRDAPSAGLGLLCAAQSSPVQSSPVPSSLGPGLLPPSLSTPGPLVRGTAAPFLSERDSLLSKYRPAIGCRFIIPTAARRVPGYLITQQWRPCDRPQRARRFSKDLAAALISVAGCRFYTVAVQQGQVIVDTRASRVDVRSVVAPVGPAGHPTSSDSETIWNRRSGTFEHRPTPATAGTAPSSSSVVPWVTGRTDLPSLVCTSISARVNKQTDQQPDTQETPRSCPAREIAAFSPVPQPLCSGPLSQPATPLQTPHLRPRDNVSQSAPGQQRREHGSNQQSGESKSTPLHQESSSPLSRPLQVLETCAEIAIRNSPPPQMLSTRRDPSIHLSVYPSVHERFDASSGSLLLLLGEHGPASSASSFSLPFLLPSLEAPVRDGFTGGVSWYNRPPALPPSRPPDLFPRRSPSPSPSPSPNPRAPAAPFLQPAAHTHARTHHGPASCPAPPCGETLRRDPSGPGRGHRDTHEEGAAALLGACRAERWGEPEEI